jgi:hypothetical protein
MTNEYANWKIMVYISADGLLANFAVESLKQLKRAAGDGVVVVAQLDANGITPAKLYVFDGSDTTKPLVDSKPRPVNQPADEVPNPEDLRAFIDSAMGSPPQAKYHALFLWGHGPELLSDEDPVSEAAGEDKKKDSGKPIRKYLTPSELKWALSKTNFARAGHKLNIIGMDACSMSMAEIASELGEYVAFMVASQDDVPDLSFPYQDILQRLREPANANDASSASTMIPAVYRDAYLDYIANPRTGVRAITMSTIDLAKMDRVTTPLTELANLLLALSKNKDARGEILEARQKSQGFVFGLFVDIVDLCQQLKDSSISSPELKDACAKMQEVVKGKEVVVANEVHVGTGGGAPPDRKVVGGGLSIYFPYRVPDPTEGLLVLRKGGKDHPTKERSLRIQELERDFAELQQFRNTGWNKFIQQGWSSILANEAKPKHLVLDEVYSAQQCAQNLGALGHVQEPPREYEAKPPATATPSAREEPAA